MPLFVMIGWDGPEGPARRAEFRDQHVAYISSLNDAGRIKLAGPVRDDAGARSIGVVVVFSADDLEGARRAVNDDPYVAGGVFETVTVNHFRHVFPQPV